MSHLRLVRYLEREPAGLGKHFTDVVLHGADQHKPVELTPEDHERLKRSIHFVLFG